MEVLFIDLRSMSIDEVIGAIGAALSGSAKSKEELVFESMPEKWLPVAQDIAEQRGITLEEASVVIYDILTNDDEYPDDNGDEPDDDQEDDDDWPWFEEDDLEDDEDDYDPDDDEDGEPV